jgi:hypothetical protein
MNVGATLVVRPSPQKLRLVIAGAAVSAALGVVVIVAGGGAGWGAVLIIIGLIGVLFVRSSSKSTLFTLDEQGLTYDPTEGSMVAWQDVARVQWGWANFLWYYLLQLVITRTEGTDDDKVRLTLMMVEGPKEVAEEVARRAGKPLERCGLGDL